jgi:hypothetical protein
MKFLFGWAIKLSFLAAVALVMTGQVKVSLPEKIMGYEVPPQARAWAERGTQITDIATKTQSGFKQINDSFR